MRMPSCGLCGLHLMRSRRLSRLTYENTLVWVAFDEEGFQIFRTVGAKRGSEHFGPVLVSVSDSFLYEVLGPDGDSTVSCLL